MAPRLPVVRVTSLAHFPEKPFSSSVVGYSIVYCQAEPSVSARPGQFLGSARLIEHIIAVLCPCVLEMEGGRDFLHLFLFDTDGIGAVPLSVFGGDRVAYGRSEVLYTSARGLDGGSRCECKCRSQLRAVCSFLYLHVDGVGIQGLIVRYIDIDGVLYQDVARQGATRNVRFGIGRLFADAGNGCATEQKSV